MPLDPTIARPFKTITLPNGCIASVNGSIFCSCSTDSTVQDKEITLYNIDKVPNGYSIYVWFINSQGYNGVPRLKVTLVDESIRGVPSITLDPVPIKRKFGASAENAGYFEWESGELLQLVCGYGSDSEYYNWSIVDGTPNHLARYLYNNIATVSETSTYLGIS